MKNTRTSFPANFWVANSIEILERFAYYGIFMILYAFMKSKNLEREDLGIVQSIFLFVSYFIPVFSGTFADRFGFKRVLIISYLAYIPSILMLIWVDTLPGIAMTVLSIGFAAGIFKPLISGTVRLTTDSTNKTLGFGIFYMMVNIGASFGPIVAAKMRAISWEHAFITAAAAITLMLIITLLFYKEPEREISKVSSGEKINEIFSTLKDKKFALFLLILGLFFWMPFWAFFNIAPAYVTDDLNSTRLYNDIANLLGEPITRILSSQDDKTKIWHINGEAIAHTGWIILMFQVFISRTFEKRRAIPSFMFGLVVSAIGFVFIGFSMFTAPAFVLVGIIIFAFGEMITSPRIQEYITWIAPKEKAGLYMGANFLATCIGALMSGLYTGLFGIFEKIHHAEYIWYILAGHYLLSVVVIYIFIRKAGEFKEMSA